MVLPNPIGQQQQQNQQRWTSKKTTQHHIKPPYTSHKPSSERDNREHRDRDRDRDRDLPSSKKSQSNSSLSSGHQQRNTITNSSTTSLPETFGLPSNSINNSSYSSTKSGQDSTALLKKPTPTTTTTTSHGEVSNDVVHLQISTSPSIKNDDIEIISEIEYIQAPLNSTAAADESSSSAAIKSHLAKSYAANNLPMSIAAKPQSNFVNNVTCLSRMLVKNDLYTSKLRRCKPYSSVKPSLILNEENRNLDSDDDGESGGVGNDGVKARKVILIDDSNEEIHKPWISPELIKLIKHRNLLQAKLNESKHLIGIDLESINSIEETGVDAELLKKFKNLRNKVINRFFKEEKKTMS